MSCFVCSKFNKKLFQPAGDCVEDALDKIRSHYLYFRNAYKEKDQQLQLLQERNEKLMKAIELLQRDQQQLSNTQLSNSPADEDCPKKRRRTSVLANRRSSFELTFSDESSAPELNMALNSEQLLNASALSPTPNESVAETEKLRSPRILRTTSTWTGRREMVRKLREGYHKNDIKCNNENKSPLLKKSMTTLASDGELPKSPTEWLSKERKNSSFNDNSSKFIQPRTIENNVLDSVGINKKERKAQLSLKKSSGNKMKQTRLQWDVKRDRSRSEITSGEEAVGESPNSSSAVQKKSKSSRTWTLRTSSSTVSASTSKLDEKWKTDDDDDDIFNFSQDTKAKIKAKLETKAHSNNGTEFELRLDATAEDKLLPSLTSVSDKLGENTPSVVIMPQATQEIICLDDTLETTNADIESIDLLTDLMKCNNATLSNLERIESVKIKQIQKEAAKVETKSKTPALPKVVNSCGKQIKHERFTQISKDADDKTTFMENAEQTYSEDIDNEMVRPIMVKDEPVTKTNIKERFNIDCIDCQKYIDFLGGRLSDKEIEEHLSKCTRHKEREAYMALTPEGFWNPLMQSFAENDPRNEVLIDTRFIGTKRNS